MILLTAFFAFLLPIGALVYWRKRTGLGIVPFAAGALCFLLFAMGLEQVLHSFCLVSDNPVSRVIKSSPWITALYGCLAAGICEESGRLFGFRLLLRRQKAREVSVAYGIGHGGIESILTLGLTYVILALASFGITMGDAGTDEMLRQTVSAASSGTLLLAMFERAAAMVMHIGLSVLVFYAVNRPGKMYFFPIAVFLHALADFPVGLYQTGILSSMPLTEAAVFAGALIIFGIASVVYKRMDA